MFGDDTKEKLLLLEILEEVRCIHRDVKRILHCVGLKRLDFKQIGGSMPTNFSIVVGTSGSFSAVLTPSNGATNGTPQWSASDPSIVLTPTADGLNCSAAVPAGSALTSFTLTLTAVSADPTIGTLTAVHTITVTQPTPPALTAVDFVQTA